MYTIERSKARYEVSKRALAGGVAGSLRAAMKPVPLFADSGEPA